MPVINQWIVVLVWGSMSVVHVVGGGMQKKMEWKMELCSCCLIPFFVSSKKICGEFVPLKIESFFVIKEVQCIMASVGGSYWMIQVL